MSAFHFFDISRLAKAEKESWLEQDATASIELFTLHEIDVSNYALRPSLPFNEELYASYWPVSGENESNPVFRSHCSGAKLAPSSLFTHTKTAMLKRRSKEILQRGLPASEEWLGSQDKPPQEAKVQAFVDALNDLGGATAVDNLLQQNIIDYSFRPFVTTKVLMWQELLRKFGQVGGGGSRPRPEIGKAYSNATTVGFALAHSPKDQSEQLRPLVSFCWYYPDNDLCRRGDAYIYLNQYPINRRSSELATNVSHSLLGELLSLLGQSEDEAATSVVFYTYAVLCSQVYLDEFEGALFTVNRPDMRPRIPIANDANVFLRLVELGRKVAELEKIGYAPRNLAGFDYDMIKAQVPAGFKLSWTRAIQPFDEDNETVTLTDGRNSITVPCPLDAQRLNIAGYEVIKNAWMKFNSYNFTHCDFTADDMGVFLDLINKLLEYVQLVGEIDVVMHDIIGNKYQLLIPE
jgi:hypothetical protein